MNERNNIEESSVLEESLLSPDATEETIINEFPAIEPPVTMSLSFVLAVGIAVIPMFLFGFSIGDLNAPESVIFPHHSLSMWSTAISAYSVGGMLGAHSAGRYADQHGRKKGLLVLTGYLNVIGGILHVLAPSMWVMTLARWVVGVAGGAATVLTPLYLGEISPENIRGSVGTCTQLSCVLGILFSILWSLPFLSETMWRLIFVPIPTLAALFCVATWCFLPESPRWTRVNLDDDNDAMQIAGAVDSSPVPPQFEEEEVGGVIENDGLMISTTRNGLNAPSFWGFLSNPKNRIPVVSSILFPIVQNLSGINAVFFYSTSFFEGVIDNPLTGTIAAFAVNVVATIFAFLIMDRFGRRTLLSWSAGGMLGCCFLLTIARLGHTFPPIVTVICVMLFICFFEIGLGCIPFFIGSEMIDPVYMGRVQSLSMSLNWLSSFLVGMTFPYMDMYLGAYSFVPFAFVLMGSVLYSIFILPETKGKSVELVLHELGIELLGNATADIPPVPTPEPENRLHEQ